MKIIIELVLASLRSRYRNTWGGFLWVHLNPLITYSVHCFIFSKVLNLNIPNITLFLLGGVLPWTFFSLSVEMASPALISSRDLIRSFSISPIIIITVLVLENFVNFIISFFVLSVVIYFLKGFPLNGLIYLPFSMMLFFLFTLFVCIAVSTLNAFYRDMRFITSFSLNLLFFLTPILYPASFIPENYKWIVTINPIYKIILPLRSSIYEFNSPINLLNTSWAIATTFLIFLITLFIWRKFHNELIQRI